MVDLTSSARPLQRPVAPFGARFAALALLLTCTLQPVLAQDAAVDYLEGSYTCETTGYQVPYAAHNGREVIYAEGAGITARDPKTSLVRWQGGELKHLRHIVDRNDRLLLVGEHLQLVEKDRGKRVWDFPLNCFPGECNADLLARTEGQLLVGGFGQSYNMITVVGIDDGKEAWPSWLTVCPFVRADFVDESVVLVCRAQGPTSPLLQRIDLKSRLTLFTAPLPGPGFQPKGFWASSRFLFVEGEQGGKRKMTIYRTEDGEKVRAFNVKTDGESVGFLVSPDQGRFVPWQRKGSEWHAWGMDVETGEVTWHKSWDGGRLLGQHGALVVLAASLERGSRVLGVDLRDGSVRYELPLPVEKPVAVFQRGQLLVSLPDGSFMVASAEDGRPLHLGRFASPPRGEPGHFYFVAEQNRYLTLDGNRVDLFDRTPLSTQTEAMAASLDRGDLADARTRYERLEPFRGLVGEIASLHDDLVRFRFLRAEAALREGSGVGAAELLEEWLSEAAEMEVSDFVRWYPRLARVALPLSLTHQGEADLFLVRVLRLFQKVAGEAAFDTKGGLASAEFVATAIAVAAGVGDPGQNAEAFDALRRLHGNAALAGDFESHPYWTLFLVEEVRTTLSAADEAQKIGEVGLSADLLHDLAKLPMAGQLFGASFDPWIDAQGVYLMPPELQAQRLPGMLQALGKQLDKAAGEVLEESRRDVCSRRCGLAERHCPGQCIDAELCTRAADRCRRECARKGPRFAPPPFSVEPTSAEFPRCR